MKRKLHKAASRKVRFDSAELLVLAFMTLVLMLIVIWGLGYLPDLFNQFSQATVLGASSVR